MAEPGGRIPRLVFDDVDRPGEEQFRIFHETVAPLFATRPRRPLDEFWARATDYLVDDVVVSSTAFAAQSLVRSERLARRSDSDWLAVLVVRSGRLFGEAGDVTLAVGPGDVAVVDMSRPLALRSDGSDLLWACVRRDLLPAPVRPDRDATPVRWAASDTRAATVRAATGEVWARLPDAPRRDAGPLAAEVLEVVGSALASRGSATRPEVSTAALKQFVRDNLDDLDLGVATLRDRFHCSRSSLYRAFEAEGGVAAHIRELRLQRCFDELTAPTGPVPSVSEVATRWGFESPSHFNRLFKALVGQAPSVVRDAARARRVGVADDGRTARQIDQFHRWARAG